MRNAAILLTLFVLNARVHGQADPVSRAWNEPVPPFRIAGNVWYVGAADVTSFLITSSSGHVLLDGGFEETAPQILANIAALGFRVEDVRLLLNSHAHYDHAGGLSALRRATGARFVASRGDVPLLARGGMDDPQFGDRFPFPPLYADGLVADRASVRVGNITMTAHVTPGHTPGCTTWQTTVVDGGRRLNVVFVCSSTVPRSYRLIGNARYPDAEEDYRRGFARLRQLDADVFLASHGNFFELAEKSALIGQRSSLNPFIDAEGYRKFIDSMAARFEAHLNAERARPR